MSEAELRSRAGSPADRRMSTASAAATGAGASLAIGLTDWFFTCYQHGQFVFAAPSQQLIEMGAPLVVLPAGLWVARVLGLIGQIITNYLEKDAGDKS